jgi:hypothetical protein
MRFANKCANSLILSPRTANERHMTRVGSRDEHDEPDA